jgi:hypothetical protein
VAGQKVVMAMPYGPRPGGGGHTFGGAAVSAIKEKWGNASPCFVSDWYTYHVYTGETHCATNARRGMPDAKWWE